MRNKKTVDRSKINLLSEIILKKYEHYFDVESNPDKAQPAIKELVLDIVNEAYKIESKNDYLIQSEISELVRCVKNKIINKDWKDTDEFAKDGFYQRNGCQPSVSKHLESLCKEKRVLKIENDVYVPYNLTDARKILKNSLIDSVSFNRGTIFVISSNQEEMKSENDKEKDYVYATCSMLVDVRYDYIATAKELFKQYIGVKSYYDIMDFQGKMLIMIHGSNDEVIELRKDIRDIVKESYKKERKK